MQSVNLSFVPPNTTIPDTLGDVADKISDAVEGAVDVVESVTMEVVNVVEEVVEVVSSPGGTSSFFLGVRLCPFVLLPAFEACFAGCHTAPLSVPHALPAARGITSTLSVCPINP